MMVRREQFFALSAASFIFWGHKAAKIHLDHILLLFKASNVQISEWDARVKDSREIVQGRNVAKLVNHSTNLQNLQTRKI